MNDLKVNGKQDFMGSEIDVIEGGFGENKKAVLAKDISLIHKVELKYINKLVKNNLSRFNNNDLVNLLSSSEELRNFADTNGWIGSNRTQDVFLLSERGYSKLVSMMDNNNETKWKVMDKFIDEYFEMREAIKESISAKDLAILAIVNAKSDVEQALAICRLELTVTQPLIETIEKQKPMVALAELRIDKQGCYSLTDITKTLLLKRGQITKWAKAKEYIHKTIQEVNIAGEKFFKVYSTDGKYKNIGIKEDGLQEINNRLEEIKTY